MDIKEIKNLMVEFRLHRPTFQIRDMTLDMLNNNKSSTNELGVYVFWKNGEVIRVGRTINKRKGVLNRALEHITDNTCGIMEALKGDQYTHLLLFTVTAEDLPWVLALERYFEERLNPKCPPGRKG